MSDVTLCVAGSIVPRCLAPGTGGMTSQFPALSSLLLFFASHSPAVPLSHRHTVRLSHRLTVPAGPMYFLAITTLSKYTMLTLCFVQRSVT